MRVITKIFASVVLLATSSSVLAVATLPNGVNCSTAELTSSLSCVGVYDPGNDNGTNTIFTDTTFINKYGTGWTLLSKTEDPSWAAGNLNLTITGQGSTSGTWSIDSWGGNTQVLGILKAGNDAAAYEMDLSSLSGDWDVSTQSWAEADGKNNALSHLGFWVRGGKVPEPSVILLFAAGLVGFGLVRRKA